MTAFKTALKDLCINMDPNNDKPLPLSIELINQVLAWVSHSAFPHHALKTQMLWMNLGMRKPVELFTRKTPAGITKINSCLSFFPGGNQDAKILDPEHVGLLEWSLLQTW